MLQRPKLVFGSLGALAVISLIATAWGGSPGVIEGEPDIPQQIANVTMPLFILTVMVIIVLGVIYLVKRGRA